MRLALLRDLHFTCIFIDAIKSELLTLKFQSDIVRISSSYQTMTLLLQSEPLNQLKWTPLATTIYLLHLANPTHSHHLPSICLTKCIKNEMFHFFTRDWEKNNKKHFHSVEIGNDILIYINIKRLFQMGINYTRC